MAEPCRGRVGAGEGGRRLEGRAREAEPPCPPPASGRGHAVKGGHGVAVRRAVAPKQHRQGPTPAPPPSPTCLSVGHGRPHAVDFQAGGGGVKHRRRRLGCVGQGGGRGVVPPGRAHARGGLRPPPSTPHAPRPHIPPPRPRLSCLDGVEDVGGVGRGRGGFERGLHFARGQGRDVGLAGGSCHAEGGGMGRPDVWKGARGEGGVGVGVGVGPAACPFAANPKKARWQPGQGTASSLPTRGNCVWEEEGWARCARPHRAIVHASQSQQPGGHARGADTLATPSQAAISRHRPPRAAAGGSVARGMPGWRRAASQGRRGSGGASAVVGCSCACTTSPPPHQLHWRRHAVCFAGPRQSCGTPGPPPHRHAGPTQGGRRGQQGARAPPLPIRH